MTIKRFFRPAMLCATVLAALSIGSVASAASLTNNFKDSNGKVFQTETVLSIEKVGTAINIRDAAGLVHSYVDSTGSVMTAVLASSYVASHYVQVPGTSKYMHTTNASDITCYYSSQSMFTYPGATQQEAFADGCQLWQAVKAISN